MRRQPTCDDAKPQHPFGCRNKAHFGGLRHNRGLCTKPLAKANHAAVAELLVHNRCKPHFAFRRYSVGFERSHGVHHRRESGFVIDRAAPVELASPNLRAEWINIHPLYRDGVGVGLEHDPPRCPAWNACDQIGAPWKDLLFESFDAAAREKRAKIRHHIAFTTSIPVGRVDRIDTN